MSTLTEQASDLPARVAEIDWFHSIQLRPGLKTRGSDDTARRVDILQLPDDLTGKTVLDVGAWDGFFSFEAERRGAERVVALDSHAWTLRDGRGKAGFDLARDALGSHHDTLSAAASAMSMDPWVWVLAGGEDHALVATFPGEPPAGWTTIGRVLDSSPRVLLDGEQWHGDTGWQSF